MRERRKEAGGTTVLGRRSTDQISFAYRATFNNGSLEEVFLAADDAHASRVAHDIAIRKGVRFDAVQRVAAKTPGGETEGRIFDQNK